MQELTPIEVNTAVSIETIIRITVFHVSFFIVLFIYWLNITSVSDAGSSAEWYSSHATSADALSLEAPESSGRNRSGRE